MAPEPDRGGVVGRRLTGSTLAALALAAAAPAATAGPPAPEVSSLRYTVRLGFLADSCALRCGPGVTVDRRDPSFRSLAALLPTPLPPSSSRLAVPDADLTTLEVTLADGRRRTYRQGVPAPLARLARRIEALLPADLHEDRQARREIRLRGGARFWVSASAVVRDDVRGVDLVLGSRGPRRPGDRPSSSDAGGC